METFTCSLCEAEKPVQTSGGTGYATKPDSGDKICYRCMADVDRDDMRSTGRATLYLVGGTRLLNKESQPYEITNWPGSLRFRPTRVSKGYHNIARTRYDAWFIFEGDYWHGVSYGENTQILHCRRTKR